MESMEKLTVWLMICLTVAATTFLRGSGRVPLDVVRSGVIGVLVGSIVYSILAIASVPFIGE